MKKVALNLSILFISSLVTLLISEGALRLLAKDLIPLGVPSRELGYIGRKNIETTRLSPESEKEVLLSRNSEGFLDRKWEIDEGEKRIMILGDSFVEANQVAFEERFTQLLEGKYSQAGESARVYNLSLSGTGPETHLRYLKKYFEIIKPDIVVEVIFNGNDFENVSYEMTPNSGRVTYEVINDEVMTHESRATWSEKIKWELRLQLGKLYLVQLIKQAQVRFVSKKEGIIDDEAKWRSAPLYCDVVGQDTKDSFAIMEHILKDMRDLAGDDFVVVQIPDQRQVVEAPRLEMFPNCDSKLPEISVEEIAQRQNIHLLQLLPIMEESTESLYFGNWGHLNYAGHELVASSLYSYLEDSKKEQDSNFLNERFGFIKKSID